MSYVTLAEFKTYVRNEISTSDDTDLQMVLDTADLLINDICQRSFTVSASSSARTYVPRCGESILRIHDCTAVASVVENGTTLTVTTDYQLEPVNRTTWAGETFPYEQIRRQGGNWYTSRDTGTVIVTATWSWPTAVPAAVKLAERVIGKDVLKHRDISFGLVASEFGAVKARVAPLVATILAPYRRLESFGVA